MSGEANWRAALTWAGGEPPPVAAMVAAGIGMGFPVLVGALMGHVALGTVAAAGGMMLTQAGTGPGGVAARLNECWILLATAGLAGLVAVLMPSGGSGGVAIALVAGLAALIGGISRHLAGASARFAVYLVLLSGMMASSGGAGRLALLGLVGVGAVGTTLLGLLAGTILPGSPGPALATRPVALRHRLARWRAGLATRQGWMAAGRLTIGLAVAAAADSYWPGHHLHWTAMTVALLCARQPQGVGLRVAQRGLGVALGVALTGFLPDGTLPLWALALVIGVLGALRPWLQARNRLLAAACSTPLILLMLDFGHVPGPDMLLDRLIATALGVVIVIGVDRAAMRWGEPQRP